MALFVKLDFGNSRLLVCASFHPYIFSCVRLSICRSILLSVSMSIRFYVCSSVILFVHDKCPPYRLLCIKSNGLLNNILIMNLNNRVGLFFFDGMKKKTKTCHACDTCQNYLLQGALNCVWLSRCDEPYFILWGTMLSLM